MNSLALDVGPGRPAKAVSVEVVRELTQADLMLVGTGPTRPTTLKKLRDSHHAVARLIAEGKTNAEIGTETGYGQSRISTLKGDPAFQELIASYRKDVDAAKSVAFAGTLEKMSTIHNDFLDELQDRLDTQPETMSTDTILDAVKLLADRTGFGAQSRTMNVNVNVDLAERIALGRQRAARASGPVIEGELVSQPALPRHEGK